MWMKVDDGLHNHRKTRAVIKGKGTRDAAPMGLWVLAGSWAAQNNTDGWVPTDELDRWDDDPEALASRLVAAGYWWPQDRDGEQGYGFNDWHDYNDPSDAASKAGTFGNHVRWHVNEKRIEPDCGHCPTEPDEPEDRGDIGGRSGGDSLPESGGESQLPSGAIALPEPEPPPEPEPETPKTLVAAGVPAVILAAEFSEFWDLYPRKVAKPKALAAHKAARKRASADAILDGLIRLLPSLLASEERFRPHAASWLNADRWNDPIPAPPRPQTGSRNDQTRDLLDRAMRRAEAKEAAMTEDERRAIR